MLFVVLLVFLFVPVVISISIVLMFVMLRFGILNPTFSVKIGLCFGVLQTGSCWFSSAMSALR